MITEWSFNVQSSNERGCVYVCVCVGVRERESVCVHECVGVCACERERWRVYVCLRGNEKEC